MMLAMALAALGGCANSTRVPSVQVPGQVGSPAIGTFHGPAEAGPDPDDMGAPPVIATPHHTSPPVTRYTPLAPAAPGQS